MDIILVSLVSTSVILLFILIYLMNKLLKKDKHKEEEEIKYDENKCKEVQNKEIKMIEEIKEDSKPVLPIEEKPLSVKDMLTQVLENQKNLEKDKKIKWWKIPWKARVNGRKAQKGWATIQIIKDNGEVEFIKSQTKDGVVVVDGFPRVASIDHKLAYRGKPLYIIPAWSMKPFSAVENYAETEKEKMNIAGRRAVLATLETEKIKAKKDFGMIGWIILGAVVIGGVYYLAKSQGWM